MKIILSGCCGKMGHAVTEAALKAGHTILAGVDKFGAGTEHGCSFPVYTDISKCPADADVIIDFSRPDALPMILKFGERHTIPMVLASTGYNENDLHMIAYTAENVPILRSANMSLAVNLLKQLASEASAVLNSTFDIEIIEKHHNTKVDAPSGTAMMLANAVNEAAGGDLEFVYDRHERTAARSKRELGLHAIRGGTITGDHTVLFAGQDELIELTHSASSRRIYALGALQAAEFIVGLPCGLYDMSSLLTQKRIITHAYSVDTDVILTVGNIRKPAVISAVIDALREAEIIIDIISQPMPVNDVYTLSLSVPSILCEKAQRIMEDVLDEEELSVTENISKLSVEGAGMAHHSGAAAQILDILYSLSIPVLLITTSETKVTCCVPTPRVKEALEALKACFTTEE